MASTAAHRSQPPPPPEPLRFAATTRVVATLSLALTYGGAWAAAV